MNLDVIRPVTGLLYDLRTGKQGLKSNIRIKYIFKSNQVDKGLTLKMI